MTPEPPLSRGEPAGSIAPRDHAVCIYRRPVQLRDAFADFIRDAHQKGDLSVFVHSFDDEARAHRFARAAHPSAAEASSANLLIVDHYENAFHGDGPRIDTARVESVLTSLIDTARDRDAAGVRIFVDASHQYFGAGRDEEWFDFEAWLGRTLEHHVGLVCAYRHDDLNDPSRMERVLKAHAYRYGEATA